MNYKVFEPFPHKSNGTFDDIFDIEKYSSIEEAWEAKEYDAIMLTAEGEWSTRFSKPYSLCGWYCECILIMNEGIVQQI